MRGCRKLLLFPSVKRRSTVQQPGGGLWTLLTRTNSHPASAVPASSSQEKAKDLRPRTAILRPCGAATRRPEKAGSRRTRRHSRRRGLLGRREAARRLRRPTKSPRARYLRAALIAGWTAPSRVTRAGGRNRARRFCSAVRWPRSHRALRAAPQGSTPHRLSAAAALALQCGRPASRRDAEPR